MAFERKNKELMEKQDYEINLATLNERNRIARDIHDNVGHTCQVLFCKLVLYLLQVKMKIQKVRLIKDTLSKAMDSRNSVHNLHDESIDLYAEIRTLINNFKFCSRFDYDIEGDVEQSEILLYSSGERSLSNIAKHSNATSNIILREHPALFNLWYKTTVQE